MCTQPVEIFNKTSYVTQRFAGMMQVPCGHCVECREFKQQDYEVRSYWEFEKASYFGGYLFSDTLTYNNKSLPRVFGVPCFSRDHITNFFKRLRRNINKKVFGHCKSKAGEAIEITYLLTSEYGKTTHRPHYHVAIFVHDNRLSVPALKSCIRQSWPYGFIDSVYNMKKHTTSKYVPECSVNPFQCVRYVTKYVTKDLDYTSHVEKELTKIATWLDLSKDENLEKFNQIKDQLAENKPFMRISHGFGEYALDRLSKEYILKGLVYYQTNEDVKKWVSFSMYYKRKVFYDLTERMNEDGEVVKWWKLNVAGKDFVRSQYKQLLQSTYNTLFKCYVSMPHDRANEIMKILGDRSLKQVARYKLLFKDCKLYDFAPSSDIKHFFDIKIDCPDEELYLKKFIPVEIPVYGGITYLQNYLYSNQRDIRIQARFDASRQWTFNNLEEFQGFDQILHICQQYRSEVNTLRDNHYKKVSSLQSIHGGLKLLLTEPDY